MMLKSLSDMLGICVHIALEDSVKGSKQAHETFPINSGDLNFTLSNDIGGSGFAQEESTFAEVVTRAVWLNLGRCGSSLKALCSYAFSFDYDVEIVAFISFCDDLGAWGKCLLFDSIGDLTTLVVVNALKDGNWGKEVLVTGTFVCCCILHDMIEGISVKLIKSARSSWHNGSRTRGVVEKSKFTESFTLLIVPEVGWGVIVRAQQFGTIKLSFSNKIEDTTCFTFSDDCGASIKLLLFHGVDDHVQFIIVEGLENDSCMKAIPNCILDLLCFLHNMGYEFLLPVILAKYFSRDTYTLISGILCTSNDYGQLTDILFSLRVRWFITWVCFLLLGGLSSSGLCTTSSCSSSHRLLFQPFMFDSELFKLDKLFSSESGSRYTLELFQELDHVRHWVLWFLLEQLRDHICQDWRHLLLQVWVNRKDALFRLSFTLHFSFWACLSLYNGRGDFGRYAGPLNYFLLKFNLYLYNIISTQY